MTYLFSGNNGMTYTSLRGCLQNINIHPLEGPHIINGQLQQVKGKVAIEKVTLLHISSLNSVTGYDHNTYTIQCDVQNLHTADSMYPLVRKDELHKHLADTDLIARTQDLSEFKYSAGAYIIRPSNMAACAGRDIVTVDNARDFAAAKKMFEGKIKDHKGIRNKALQYYKVIVSEYIYDPLLLNGKKLHLRSYLISTTTGVLEFSKFGQILTAQENYVAGDWSNKAIHDSHHKSTAGDYFYPEDFPAPEFIPALDEFYENLKVALRGFFRPQSYEQARNSYCIYGLDIMFWRTGRPVLIEINDRPGLGVHNTYALASLKYVEDFNGWAWDNIKHMF